MENKAIIIEARCSSKRLPNKTLMKICGHPTIKLMIERLKRVKNVDKIILATTTKKCDKKLVSIAKEQGIDFFCGSEDEFLWINSDIREYLTNINSLNDLKIYLTKFFSNEIYLQEIYLKKRKVSDCLDSILNEKIHL